MKKILSTIALALSLVLATPAVLPQTAVVAQAATSVDLWDTSIGINQTAKINVYDAPSKAKISYSSNKKSVATVSSKGLIKGVSVGKAKITIKETYKGKTRKVGTLSIDLIDPTYTGDKTLRIYQDQMDNITYYFKGCGGYRLYWNDKDFTDEEALQSDHSDDTKVADDIFETVLNDDGSWDGEILGKNPGIRYAALIQYNYLTQEFDKVFARFKIEVVEEIDY